MRAESTSRFAAYPKISSWISGGMNSIMRMRGSRSVWMNSLRIMRRSRCRMIHATFCRSFRVAR